ncbi:MAG: chitinase, partial [Stackebrandtia sp.]
MKRTRILTLAAIPVLAAGLTLTIAATGHAEPSKDNAEIAELPKHALIGYLHTSFANGSGYTRLADVPEEWDIIN